MEVVADPPPLACVSALASNSGSVVLRWFRAPAGLDDLHHMVDKPGDFLEFLVHDPRGFSFCHEHNPCDTALAKQRQNQVR